MLIPGILLLVLLAICAWVAYRVRKVPRKAEHERTPVKRDVFVEISRWPGPGGGV